MEKVEDGFPDWHRVGAWGGQTVFTFPCEEKVQHFDIADTCGNQQQCGAGCPECEWGSCYLPKFHNKDSRGHKCADCGYESDKLWALAEPVADQDNEESAFNRVGDALYPKMDEDGGETGFAPVESMLQRISLPTIPEGELMFHIHDDLAAEIAQIGPPEDMCAVCEMRPVLASCGCCEKPAGTCGACCLLRHTEGRYQVHKPDENSTTF